jgi:SAM-dependent methyltransferase
VEVAQDLGIPPETPEEQAREALAKKRQRMQGMQGNPKFKESASHLIKNFRRLERAVSRPRAHLDAMRRERERERIPMLELALEGVMADGRISVEEEAFLREACFQLGIREERYEEVLHQRVAERGVILEVGLHRHGPEVDGDTLHVSPEAETTARLRGAEGYGWWDATFTRMLLECVPGGPGEMVDLYCRTGLSASTLLPERPQLTWLGVDPNPERLERAQQALAAQSARALARVTLTCGAPTALPIGAEAVDHALAIRALQNLPDTRPVFVEAWRVLRPGGTVIGAEPDGLAETFYFGGHLASYNAAFHRLLVEIDAAAAAGAHPLGRPGMTIGPTLHARMEAAGFSPGAVRVHASANLKPVPFARFAGRLRRYPQALAQAAGLADSELLRAVQAEVDALEARIPTDHVGMAGNVLPLFLVVGEKDP